MPSENIVHIAIELSFSSWLVAARLTGAKKSRLHRIEGGDTGALLALIAKLRSRALTQLGGAAEVACCFEAGRDGVGRHRLLPPHGILVSVLEPTSILVNRRSRRAKTDRLDAEGMLPRLRHLRRHHQCRLRRVAKTDRPARNHHLHHNTRMGTYRSKI